MRHYSWNSGGWGGRHASASASATKSYHNGGVEGDAFSDWYNKHLADRFNDPDEDGSGSGSGGSKGSGSGGSKGSGSGGSKGSGSGGSKGSGSGGSKGSGSGGSKGSGSGGSKGSGSGGSKGSGSGGSKGSGSGGSKGSGGSHGSDCDTSDSSDKSTLTYIMGTDPQVQIEVSETSSGTLFFDLRPTTFEGEPADINGIFFNLTNDSELSSLVFFPEANQGSQYSQVTGTQADANSVNTLADGTSVPGQFDAAIQFGTEADTTNGAVNAVNFTLWSQNGPLTFEDIDLGGMTLLADSEATGGMVMSVTDSDDETCDHTNGTHGSGSGGSKGSGSGGSKGSGSGGSKGSGSGGSKGSGSGGSKGSGSGGSKGSGSGGSKGSGSGGSKGSGSGGSKGSGSGGSKGSGSGGSKGSGSGGSKGSGSGGSKGSGSGGSKGSGSGGSKGSGSGGSKGSGSGGSKGSGSGGSKGSGSGGSHGSSSSSWRTAATVASGTGPGLDDIMALMTNYPDEDDPSLKEEHDPWEDDGTDFML